MSPFPSQFIVDAFTDQLFAGNPAAVCLQPLPEALMQRVAQENNLSETAFLTKTGDGYALRWFTPAGEIDLCGHATLAAAHVVLTQLEPGRQQVTFHTCSGPLPVQKQGDRYEMDFPAYTLSPVPVTEAMAAAFGARPTAAYLGRDLLCVFDREETVGGPHPGPGGPQRAGGSSPTRHRPGAGGRLRLPLLRPQVRGAGGPGVRLRPLPHLPLLGPGPGKGHSGGLAGLPPGRHPLRHPGGGPGEAVWEGRDLRRHHVFPPWRFPYGPVPEALTFLCAPVG